MRSPGYFRSARLEAGAPLLTAAGSRLPAPGQVGRAGARPRLRTRGLPLSPHEPRSVGSLRLELVVCAAHQAHALGAGAEAAPAAADRIEMVELQQRARRAAPA